MFAYKEDEVDMVLLCCIGSQSFYLMLMLMTAKSIKYLYIH